MGYVLELAWHLFAEVIVRSTGHALLSVATLGRYSPGEEDEWPPYVVGGLFWLGAFVAVFLLARPR